MECVLCGEPLRTSFHRYDRFELLDCPPCDLLQQPEQLRHGNEALIRETYDARWIAMREAWVQSTYLDHAQFNLLLLHLFHPGKGQLLEIGCGTGEFLHMARGAGWQVTGIEPSAASCAYVAEKYALPLVHGVWRRDLPMPVDTFDAIALWHVLEHMPDPVVFMGELADRLPSGGHLFVSVPNRYAFINETHGPYSPLFTEVDHLFHYSAASLRALVERAGLSVEALVSRQLPGPLDTLTAAHPQYGALAFTAKMALLSKLQSEMRGHELCCVARKA